MANLLHIDSSPRGDVSISRKLSRFATDQWQKRFPAGNITYRDLYQTPPDFVSSSWIEGAVLSPDQRTNAQQSAMDESDRWIDLLFQNDHWILGVPMHNLNVPAVFKAWLDQIVRVGRTYTESLEGLIHGKRVLVITSRGSIYQPGTPWAAYDFQEPYLKGLLGVLGVRDITFVNCEGTQSDSSNLEKFKVQAQERILSWVEKL